MYGLPEVLQRSHPKRSLRHKNFKRLHFSFAMHFDFVFEKWMKPTRQGNYIHVETRPYTAVI